MIKKNLVQIVLEACEEKAGKKRLTCAVAFGLAKKHQVKIGKIGEICDEQGIKIVACQLGCFGG